VESRCFSVGIWWESDRLKKGEVKTVKTDEEIDLERKWLELLIGPTRAGWYAEACEYEHGADPGELLWACRYREMAMEAGHLEERLVKVGESTEQRLRETQQTITQWCHDTFGPSSSNFRIFERALEEVRELQRKLGDHDCHPGAGEEIADVFICLYRLASDLGVDLHAEIDRKMQINRNRKWQCKGDGTGSHIKE
jgi:NTP pyrophosphatase (non-canonical NTP hydrolase)